MAVDYPIPPWLANTPDPVAAYSHGLQIGSQIGTEQARQQMAQEQLLRETQKDLVDQEIEKGKFHLASDAAARRYADQAKFTSLVQGGMDPATAMLQVPGIAPETSALIKAANEGKMTDYQTAEVAHMKKVEDRLSNRTRYHAAGGGLYKETPTGLAEIVPPPGKGEGTLDPIDAGMLRNRLKTLDDIQKMIIANPPTKGLPILGGGNLEKVADLKKQEAALIDEINSYKSKVRRSRFNPDTKKIEPIVTGNAIAPTETPEPDDGLGGDLGD